MDSTDRERLSITRQELHKILAHEELHQCAVLVLANKQDVKGSMSAAEISRHLNLTSIKKHKWQIQACCALTGEGYAFFTLLYFRTRYYKKELIIFVLLSESGCTKD